MIKYYQIRNNGNKPTEGERMTLKQIAERWTGKRCTLDSKPARVLGRLNNFATIAQVPDGVKADWCWDTVDRIMSAGGNFKS